jgi:hypothetical protein
VESRASACSSRTTTPAATLEQLREAVFDLHPYVLEEVNLAAAPRSIGEDALARGRRPGAVPQGRLLVPTHTVVSLERTMALELIDLPANRIVPAARR